PRRMRHVLADLDAGDVRVDRPKIAAKLRRRVGLQIKRVDGAESAVQEAKDERNVAGRPPALRRTGLQLEQTRQTKAEETRGAEAEKIAAADAVAEPSRCHNDAPQSSLFDHDWRRKSKPKSSGLRPARAVIRSHELYTIVPRPGGRMRTFDSLSEKEVLALAISLEEEDARVYDDFAEGLKDTHPAAAEEFRKLRSDEDGHRHRLLELYKQRFG